MVKRGGGGRKGFREGEERLSRDDPHEVAKVLSTTQTDRQDAISPAALNNEMTTREDARENPEALSVTASSFR